MDPAHAVALPAGPLKARPAAIASSPPGESAGTDPQRCCHEANELTQVIGAALRRSLYGSVPARPPATPPYPRTEAGSSSVAHAKVACHPTGDTLDRTLETAPDRHELPAMCCAVLDDHSVGSDAHARTRELGGPGRRGVMVVRCRDGHDLTRRLGLAELALPHDCRKDCTALGLRRPPVRESCGRYQRTGHDKQHDNAGELHRRKATPASPALANIARSDLRRERGSDGGVQNRFDAYAGPRHLRP
jgi:hypothetical protein